MDAFQQRPLSSTCAAVGAVWGAYQLYNLSSNLYLHFIRRSSLDRYKSSTSTATWALVTGSSDGIGKGFAEELCARGFNVALHGRNKSKLNGVRDALLKQWPHREVRIIVFDGMNEISDTAKLQRCLADLQDIDLRVLINNVANVGGTGAIWRTLTAQSDRDVAQCMDISAHFPTEITRLLLPQLTRDKQPALIMNIGSGASEAGTPYVAVYSACKAYNKQWSRSLNVEMKAEGLDVEVLLVQVGMVATNAAQRATSLLVPSARRMARSALDVVGCGRSVVWAYWPHAVQFGMIFALPEGLTERLVMGIAKKEKGIEEAKFKER